MYQSGPHNAITDVNGILVGHAQDLDALTGVTAVVAPGGAVVGVAVEGSAPGTRETDLCRPGNQVKEAHAVLLCGGSAFGLAAADGAMRYLEERGIGFDTGVARVPIVPAAVLFDLGIGDSRVRPTAAMGYDACAAATDGEVPQGCVGAGTGCTVGKGLGQAQATKSGIGTASITLGPVVVGAVVAVNAVGDVWDPAENRILAGTRAPAEFGSGPLVGAAAGTAGGFVDTTRLMLERQAKAAFGQNTTIGVVAVSCSLTKEEANKVARMAHDGLVRAIRPIHTMFDGDTLFCLATGGPTVDVTTVGTAAAIAVEQAVLNAIRHATAMGGLPGPALG